MARLEETTNALVNEVAGGRRERLCFALAVCGNPDVLFLDEPTVGMDVEGRRSFIERIAEFAHMGRTVVLTTHYLEEADELAQRVIVVDRGVVIADASPAEIKSRVAGKRIRFAAPNLTREMFGGLPVSALELWNGHARMLSGEPETVLRRLFASGVAI